MKISIGQKLSGQLTLTPQLQQAIRLLQMSAAEIEQELSQAVLDNPFLELESSFDEASFEPIPEYSHHSSSSQQQRLDGGDYENYSSLSKQTSLFEHLTEQIRTLRIDAADTNILIYLAGCLDEKGYLRDDFEEIKESFIRICEAKEEEAQVLFEKYLGQLQELDPPGIGARDLGECLTLQLKRSPLQQSNPKIWAVAYSVCEKHIHDLAAHNWQKLRKAAGCSEEQLDKAAREIKKLDPNPGNQFLATEQEYVTPEVFVLKKGGRWEVNVNPQNQFKLSIRKEYVDLFKQVKKAEQNEEFIQKFADAKSLVRTVQQREETILLVSKAIVDRQQGFFEHGAIAMRPLLLREIADEVGMHESTISRVTNQKYLTCTKGTFSLKYFFGSQITRDTGSTVSSKAIQTLIGQIVKNESPNNPLSDNEISELLNNEGYQIARRTIAKYRDILNIAPMHSRKRMANEMQGS